jgi:thiosulfate sulfurtransferase
MDTIPEIPIHEAKKRLDDKQSMFVDVRDPGSYRAAHIPGARHLNDTNVEAFLRDTEKETPIVVYCYHGNSSLGAVGYLREQGFTQAVSMSGGFEAWRQIYESEPAG